MYKIIELKYEHIILNVNNISYITYIDNKIIFYMNNNEKYSINVYNDVEELYNNIKEFILHPRNNLLVIE